MTTRKLIEQLQNLVVEHPETGELNIYATSKHPDTIMALDEIEWDSDSDIVCLNELHPDDEGH
jgi:hypothetical protein